MFTNTLLVLIQVLPLKNSMRNTKQFDSPVGVLNIGMTIVTTVLIAFGFFGYLKWGEETAGSLTLNLPEGDTVAIVVKLVVSLGMSLTFPLQFFVPIQIMWPYINSKTEIYKKPLTFELAFRTIMVLVICK